MKKSIELNPNIETLFGTRDENLLLIEDGLGVSIDMRSDSIEIEGPAEGVQRAEQIVRLSPSGAVSRGAEIRRRISGTTTYWDPKGEPATQLLQRLQQLKLRPQLQLVINQGA